MQVEDGIFQILLMKLEERRKPKTEDLLIFFRQIRRFFKAGISIPEGLEFYHKQCEQVRLKKATKQMVVDTGNGMALSESMAQFSFFPGFCVHSIAAGEASGTLDDIFSEIERFMEQKMEMERQMQTAMFQAKFFAAMFLIAFSVAVFLVIPMFADIFKDLHVELPSNTKFVLWVGTSLTTYWYLTIATVVGLIWFARWFANKYPEKIDRGLLKVPIYSGLYRLELQYRFAKILSLVAKSGSFADGMELGAKSIDHIPIAKMMRTAAKKIEEGTSISDAIEDSNGEQFISANTIIMIRIGEKTGQVIETLSTAADDYSKDLTQLTTTAGEKIGYSLIIPMLLMMIFIYGSVYWPVIEITSAIK